TMLSKGTGHGRWLLLKFLVRPVPLLPVVLPMLLVPLLLAACGEAGPASQGGQGTGDTGSGEVRLVGKVVKTDKGQYRDVAPAELKAMMDKEEFFHVDVHVPNEGKLPELDARIPFDKVTEELDQLPLDKSSKIVLTC